MLRRVLFLLVLTLWLGGSLFYAAVVIPVGLSTLRPPHLQTFVTRKVTMYQNGLGALLVLVAVWELACSSDPVRRRVVARWLAVILFLLTLAGLLWLHPRLDALMDLESLTITNHEAVRPLHHAYIAIGGVQILAAMALMILTVFAWRGEDRG